ncbi:hypothetical protein H072_10350 [Dactylellina haptotyla CBS 200.50]|uniref:B30.2/SPRY domain-containing protein n=1 Tax=Dactylellina haptotyla (strain CBS 200.50) TaxID=1284197 RepID=S7ZZU0_DACHA|nr:hypothetical protein H072_10350 [Dactylellina haptotyla CBS 200.50]
MATLIVQKEVSLRVAVNQLPLHGEIPLTPATPATPATPSRQTFTETANPVSCWQDAKKAFRDELIAENTKADKDDQKNDNRYGRKEVKKPKNEEELQKLQKDIDVFLAQKKSITSVILSAEKLTSSVDKRYPEALTKCLHIMQKTKEVGDVVLSNAPEIAAAVCVMNKSLTRQSIFKLQLVAVDVKRCELISNICYKFAKIVLNCRVFEHKCRDTELSADAEVIKTTLDSITIVLSQILRFIWFADRKFQFGEDKVKGKTSILEKAKAAANIAKTHVKSIFDDHTGENYERVTQRYQELLDMQTLSFNEIVLSSLRDTKMGTAKANEYLEEVLFPKAKETYEVVANIKLVLSTMYEELQESLDKVAVTKDVVEKMQAGMDDAEKKRQIEEYYKSNLRSRQTEAHKRLLETTLEPLRRDDIHDSDFGVWLFKDPMYETWKHDISALPTIDGTEQVFLDENSSSQEKPTSPDSKSSNESSQTILYLTGEAGFGKSVIMGLAIEKLQREMEPNVFFGPVQKSQGQNLPVHPESESLNPVVIFFFFKKGDSSTQLATAAARSLLAQVFQPEHYKEARMLNPMLRAIDRLKAPPQSTSESEDTTTAQSEESFSYIIGQLETAVRTIGRKVYLVIDGLDECIDRPEQNVVPRLAQLAKLNTDIFRILISSRVDPTIKNELINNMKAISVKTTESTPEEEAKIQDTSTQESAPDSIPEPTDNEDKTESPASNETQKVAGPNSKGYEYHDGAIILNISRDTNSKDMLAFLNISLRGLMQRGRLKEYFVKKEERYTLKIKPEFTKFEAVIENMARHIQERSHGMFTYSAMTITSLRQPSELRLSQRIKGLPTGMNQIYSSQLKSLTDAERKLVMLALTRIYWSNVCGVEMHTLEIVEQFKKHYEHNHGLKNAEQQEDEFEYDHLMDNAPTQKCDNKNDSAIADSPTSENSVNIIVPEQSQGRKKRISLHRRSSSFHHEHYMTTQMNNPEVADVIYHLSNAGRDFFKFSNEDRNIEFIHTSVREWMDSQTSESEKTPPQTIHGAPMLYKQNDEFKILLAVSRAEFMSVSGSTFDGARDAHLTILTHILQVLTHQKFQDIYMPVCSLPDKVINMFPDKHQSDDNDSDNGSDNKDDNSTKDETENDKKEDENSNNDTDNKGNEGAEDGEGENITTEEKDDTEEKGDDEENNNTEENDTARNEEQVAEDAIQYGEIKDADEEEQSMEVPQSHEHGERKSPWRGEIHHWIHHMRELGKLRLDEARNSPEWNKLLEVLQNFTNLNIFWRWSVQYKQVTDEISYEEAKAEWSFWGPAHLSASLDLTIYENFLQDNSLCLYSFYQQLGVTNRLHYEDIYYCPKHIETIIREQNDVSSPRESDGFTPFLICLSLLYPELENKTTGAYTKTLESLKLLAGSKADMGLDKLFLEEPYLPLHRIIKIGDEELFELVAKNPTFNLTCRTYTQSTILHTIFSLGEDSRIPVDSQLKFGKRLLELGADPNTEDMSSRMPLFRAVQGHNVEAVNMILEFEYPEDTKIIIDDIDDSGETALTYLTSLYQDDMITEGLAIIDALVKHGASLESPPDSRTLSPWVGSLWMENWEYTTRLLQHHAEKSPDNRDYFKHLDGDGDGVLQRALFDYKESNTIKMMKTVLEHPLLTEDERKSLIETPRGSAPVGDTPLLQAIDKWALQCALYLLDQNANSQAKNSSGRTAWEWFLSGLVNSRFKKDQNGYEIEDANLTENSSLRILIDRLLTPDISKIEFPTLLSEILIIDSPVILKYICSKKLDFESVDTGGWDFHDWAYAYGKVELISGVEDFTIVDYDMRKSKFQEIGNTHMKWNPEIKHPKIQISEDGLSLSFDKSELEEGDKTVAVSTTSPISPYAGLFYFEVTILTSTMKKDVVIGIGFASSKPLVDHMPGWPFWSLVGSGKGYGLHGDDGRLYSPSIDTDDESTNCPSKIFPNGPVKYQLGDTIGCGYDQDDHTIFWTQNGKFLGVAFEDVRGKLSPVVAAEVSFTAKANFGSEPWMWDQKRIVEPIPEANEDTTAPSEDPEPEPETNAVHDETEGGEKEPDVPNLDTSEKAEDGENVTEE